MLLKDRTMTLLHTQYYCEVCMRTFKKREHLEHKSETNHTFTKKIVYPAEIFDDEPAVSVHLSKPIEQNRQIDYCIDCKKEAFSVQMHKQLGHMVYSKRVGI